MAKQNVKSSLIHNILATLCPTAM